MRGISILNRAQCPRFTSRPMVAAIALSLALGLGPSVTPFASATAATDAVALPTFAPMVERVLPAVVNIQVVQKAGSGGEEGADQGSNDDEDQPPGMQGNPNGPQTPFDDFLRRFFEQQQQLNRHGGRQQSPKAMAQGSGFIIDPTGFVVTNNHVVANAEDVQVIFQDGTKHKAKVIGRDAKTDLAVVKIDAPQALPFVKFGDSDKSRVGDWIIAVGNPFGLGGTVTKGIISARGRPVEDTSYVDFLQVDASINMGNSGGPTFNLDGDVIGINTAIYSPNGGSVGIGFAIPSNTAIPVINQLKKGGKIDRGWLGVEIQDVSPEIAANIPGMDEKHPIGALIAKVTDDSPASKAGVKVQDVIEKFDGKAVEKPRDLQRIVAEAGIGRSVDIVVLRAGQLVTLHATTAQLDEKKMAAAMGGDTPTPEKEKVNNAGSLGLSLSSLNADARKRLNLPKDVNGVLISRVRDGSPAADRGLEAGDVIVQVNGQPVITPEDVIEKAKVLKGADKKSILLLINRRGANRFVPLEPSTKKSTDTQQDSVQ